MRTVTLFVPSLFWPETGDTDAYSGLRLPALETLLSRGSVADSACEDELAWLCERDGLDTSDEVLAKQFRLHLHRGIGYLATPHALRSLGDLVCLTINSKQD